MYHKVFFDVYDLAGTHKMYDGSCTIDKDWIDLGAKDRKKVMQVLQKHFESEFVIGNFRNTLKKV